MQSILVESDGVQVRAQPWHPLINAFVYFFSLALLLAVSALTIHMEVLHVGGNLGESSLVEYLQEGYLFITGALFAAVAVVQKRQRGFAILLSAFFSVMLIRELDSVLDQISHGFWKYPAWLVAVSAIGYAWFNRSTTIEPLVKYTNHKSFGMMMAGIATLLVFSRIYGTGILWHGIMQDNYLRAVKNLAEEGVELLAYTLTVFAAAWYCFPKFVKRPR